jgi:hypothetical protein
MESGGDESSYQISVTYRNGMSCVWRKKDKQFEPYILDSLGERYPATFDLLSNLPAESGRPKDGLFYKGNSDSTSWKLRYFFIRGGLMTYFKDKGAVIPQGTIPLKDCVVEFPNDKRKSFIRLGRSGLDGYELKITHPSRRPFILAFSSSKEREEWSSDLTRYIAQTFASKEYHLAEVIESVSYGLFAAKQVGVIGLDGHPDEFLEDASLQYFYLDWYSPDASQWCLRYAPQRLKLQLSSPPPPATSTVATSSSSAASGRLSTVSGRPSTNTGGGKNYEFISSPEQGCCSLPLSRISKVIQVDTPCKAIHLHVYNGSACHQGGIGEVWTLLPAHESIVALCAHAFNSILTLQNINIPTQPHRRISAVSLNSLKAQLLAACEPVSYTRRAYLAEKYAIEHGNEFDLLGAGAEEMGRSLLADDMFETEAEAAEREEEKKKKSSPEDRETQGEGDFTPQVPLPETVFQFPDMASSLDTAAAPAPATEGDL